MKLTPPVNFVLDKNNLTLIYVKDVTTEKELPFIKIKTNIECFLFY